MMLLEKLTCARFQYRNNARTFGYFDIGMKIQMKISFVDLLWGATVTQTC